MKVGGAGKAVHHAAYIAREDQYQKYTERGEKLEATASGNMPAWASSPGQFWLAADEYERKNGTTYREMEIALPRELEPAQRVALVEAFVAQELGGRHAYQWAIHVPLAGDGEAQPHVHLMFSERQVDGIERAPDEYFKRANTKNPERGGAKKGYGPNAGKTLSKPERVAEMQALRMRWQDAANGALEKAGSEARIDMRSYADRGTGETPTPYLLPSEWRDPAQRGPVVAAREANAEVRAAMPDMGAEVVDLMAERARRAEAAAIAAREAQERPQREAAARVAAERSRLRDPRRMAPEEIVTRWRAVVAEQMQVVRMKLGRVLDYARTVVDRRRSTHEANMANKPVAPTGFLAGFRRAGFLKDHEAWRRIAEPHKRRFERAKEQARKIEAYPVAKLAARMAAKAEPELARAYPGALIEVQRRAKVPVQKVEQAVVPEIKRRGPRR